MTKATELLMKTAQDAKWKYAIGAITREEAKEDVMPYINAVNAKAEELAKKYGMKAKKVSFIGFMR